MKKLVLAVALLGLASTASAADLSPACEKYFEESEVFLKNVPAAQADMYKQQFEASKTQMSSLPKDQQEQACSMALEQLKQTKSMLGIK